MPRPTPRVVPVDPVPDAGASDWADGGMTLVEVARHCGVTTRTVRSWLSAGLLPSAKPAGKRLVPRRALLRWLTEQTDPVRA